MRPLALHLPQLQVATVNGCGIGTIQFSLLNNAWKLIKAKLARQQQQLLQQQLVEAVPDEHVARAA